METNPYASPSPGDSTKDDEAAAVEAGRRQAIFICVASAAFSLFVISLTGVAVTNLVRFGLTLGLLYFFYTGRRWARILATVLFGLAFAIGAFMTINNGGFWLTWLLMIVHGVSAGLLAFSKSLGVFLERQRGRTDRAVAT